MTNKAYGVALTVGYEVSDALNFKLLASDRHSEYESGLDDDSFFDNFLSFPEVGEADQQSVELQVTGHEWCLRLRAGPVLLRRGRTQLPE